MLVISWLVLSNNGESVRPINDDVIFYPKNKIEFR